MSHQVFVDKMLSMLSTPMVFLEESSFVIARSKHTPSDGPFFRAKRVLLSRGWQIAFLLLSVFSLPDFALYKF